MIKRNEQISTKLLSLFETLKLDNTCFIIKQAYGNAVYVKDAECKLFELDDFSRHRLPFDKVLAIQYPAWFKDFALSADWVLTRSEIAAIIYANETRYVFAFNKIESSKQIQHFDEMLNYKKQWSAFIVESPKQLPLAISKRHCRKLDLDDSLVQLFKMKRF